MLNGEAGPIFHSRNFLTQVKDEKGDPLDFDKVFPSMGLIIDGEELDPLEKLGRKLAAKGMLK